MLCVVVTDHTGTPSVIGPFEEDSLAVKYANSINEEYAGLKSNGMGTLHARIAQFNAPQTEA